MEAMMREVNEMDGLDAHLRLSYEELISFNEVRIIDKATYSMQFL